VATNLLTGDGREDSESRSRAVQPRTGSVVALGGTGILRILERGGGGQTSVAVADLGHDVTAYVARLALVAG